jgi:hypothetical protein
MNSSRRNAQSLLFALVAAMLASAGVIAAPIPSTIDPANSAKNLARMNAGAQINAYPAVLDGDGGADALVMDDGTISCPLKEGETNFIISLPEAATLDRFTFINENAAARGELKIAVSNRRLPVADPRWLQVDGSVEFADKRLFSLSLVGVEAKYVRLSFQVEKDGRLANLGLYGTPTLASFAERYHQPLTLAHASVRAHRPEDILNFNFASVYARARVLHVSSGPLPAARRMIDDDALTGHSFAPEDRQPTVIVELAEKERLNRISVLYEARGGRFDVYLLDELPTFAKDPHDLNLANVQPAATTIDNKGDGKASVNFDPQGARYVVFRWTPTETSSARGLEVLEIYAFGNVPFDILRGTPDLFAQTLQNGFPRTSPDISHDLGTLADPPMIAPVSP